MVAVQESPLPSGAILVGEERITASSGGTHEHINPATGKVQATVALAGPDEIDAAVGAARDAFGAWRAMPVDQRAGILFRFADLLREHTDEFSAIIALESGTPIATGGGSRSSATWVQYYAGWADKLQGDVVPVYPLPGLDYVLPEPYGVVAVIVPWNGPVMSSAMKVAPALAAGNCVVLKPPELAPFGAIRFTELALEAGIPPGVINVVPSGAVGGEALTRHPGVDKISFTGGPETARRVMAAAAEALTPVVLELGGKSANIVFEDADLDAAAALAARLSLVVLSGQGCVLPTRLLVQDTVYDEVVARIAAMTGHFKMGLPLAPDTIMGPVISQGAVDRILGMVDRAKSDGATLVTGGERAGGDLAEGYFIAPTVFGDVAPDSELAQREVFGPVLAALRFSDEEEAVTLANSTRYGLGAYLHTNDLRRAHRVAAAVDAGYVSVNGFAGMAPGAPFGGVKESGFGREGGKAGIDEFLRPKNVFISM